MDSEIPIHIFIGESGVVSTRLIEIIGEKVEVLISKYKFEARLYRVDDTHPHVIINLEGGKDSLMGIDYRVIHEIAQCMKYLKFCLDKRMEVLFANYPQVL